MNGLRDKEKIILSFVEEFRRQLETIQKAAEDARDAATHEESIPENKYDTRGLEASYLAGAHFKRLSELKRTLAYFQQLKNIALCEDSPICIGAYVEAEYEGIERFFIAPSGGGTCVSFAGEKVMVVTPESPIGKAFIGEIVGHDVAISTGRDLKQYTIIKIL